jgi:alkylation response protein AidB-like acyl-CoA dehydrogenase
MTDDRRMIQEQAREFAMNEVLPLANKLDPVKGDIPWELIEQMGEMGYFGVTIPEEYGGLGLGYFEYCLVCEELSRAWMSVGSLMARANGISGIETWPEERRKDYLSRMAQGKFLRCTAISEPNAGSDVAAMTTRAVRDGDSWLISGQKYWCTFADGADCILVHARTEEMDPSKRHAGISTFMVEKPRGGFPEGVSGNPIPKIGYFGWRTYELSFDKCRVPAENMLGEEGMAFYRIGNTLEKARVNTAARAVAVARGALEDSIEYAKQRVQFGRPISDFQAIRFKIASMAAEIEAARQMVYAVCDQIDQGGRCDKEASMVKWFATEMAERVTSEGLQIHGGAGYTTLCAVERYWRDARITKIFEGTSEIQLRIISDRILGPEGKR